MYNGGDGIVREMLFRKPLTLSVLTERRAFRPYGLEGICKHRIEIFLRILCSSMDRRRKLLWLYRFCSFYRLALSFPQSSLLIHSFILNSG